MIDPFTGIPLQTITKSLTDNDKELLLEDDNWIYDLSLKLNVTHGTSAASGGSTTDLWEVIMFGTEDFIRPATDSHGILVGQDPHSSVTSSFPTVVALYNGNPINTSPGNNYFMNLAYGNSIFPAGGFFVSSRARGTAAAPTQALSGDWLGGYAFSGYSGSSWNFISANHTTPGLWGQASEDVTGSALEADIYLGGLNTNMIGYRTSTNQITFNNAQLDADIYFYSDTATPMIIDGGTGDITIGNGTDFIFNASTGSKLGTATTQKIGFWNATPVVQDTGWSVSNVTTDRIYDANNTSVNELADVLGTLINTLKNYGILGA